MSNACIPTFLGHYIWCLSLLWLLGASRHLCQRIVKCSLSAGDTGFQVKMLCHSLKQPVPCSHMHMALSHLRHGSWSNIHFIKDMDLTNWILVLILWMHVNYFFHILWHCNVVNCIAVIIMLKFSPSFPLQPVSPTVVHMRIYICPNDVCSTSDPCHVIYPPHYWEHVEHNRK